jgi:c-di-GMP-binding flagellar brake protein YcgR
MPTDNIGPYKDKRKSKRLRVNLSLTYRIDKPLSMRMMISNREIRATMLDLSEGGLSVLTDYNIPPLSVLFIKFTLFKIEEEDVSFYGPMEIVGEVLYNIPLGGNEYRLGIRFKLISKADKAEIINFIKLTNIP